MRIPATSSDSASGRSKGSLPVSMRRVMARGMKRSRSPERVRVGVWSIEVASELWVSRRIAIPVSRSMSERMSALR